MDPNSKVGEILEKGQQITDTAVSDVATSVKGQIIGEKKPVAASQNTASVAASPAVQNAPQEALVNTDAGSNERTREVVSDFYSPSGGVVVPAPSVSAQNEEAQLAKTREELKRYQNQHNETYYDPLISYEQKKPELTKADEAEKDQQVKMQELAQKQAKKDEDQAVKKAQTTVEVNRGVAG
ncbi:MAG: hypothetical protein COU25_00215 [Candidatus Levybacteria bacterium CG10_big_fil_rev_8_21_14_0_10_35_13]|nr:MAG: hypothetical protein COU25_00215 [Candidatus Levybacteria bacterium CG10_big_fil_rev_8_21_14_0_10_35_13]